MANIVTLRSRRFLFGWLFLCFSCLVAYPQNPGEWMWVHGSSSSNNAGNFGTQGVPSPSNEAPALYEPCEFTDHSGNFWFYGGLDINYGTGAHDDLWRYNPATKEWTWMTGSHQLGYAGNYGVMGVPAITNQPPSRSWAAQSWVDTAGNFWMIGGESPGTTTDNALWRYDLSTNLWTWMKGNAPVRWGIKGVPDPSNNPPYSLEDAAAWTDSDNNLWLLSTNGCLSKYNVATNEWTWMKGDSTGNTSTYGTKGVEAPLNNPSGSSTYCRWKDNNGYFWVYGAGYTNDLWRFNPTTNNWAMMKGDTLAGVARYNTQCVATVDNVPSSRTEDRVAWTDASNNLWMLGGQASSGAYNDLWMYSIANNEWVWASGDTTGNPTGNYGTLNVSSPTNKPLGRKGTVSWTDGACHLYMFGGSDAGYLNFYNDVWSYTINPTCGGGGCTQCVVTANFESSDTAFCSESGKCINFTNLSSPCATSWQWQFFGATPDTSSQQNPMNICYYTPGTYPVVLIASNGTHTDTLNVYPMIIFANLPPPPTINVIGGDTLYSSYGVSYQWYLNGSAISGATDSFYVAHQGGTYSVQITDNLGCNSLSNGVLITAINEVSSANELEIYPNPASQLLVINHWPLGREAIVEIYNVLGEQALSPLLWRGVGGEAINVSSLAKGLYIITVTAADKVYRTKFAKD